MPADEEGWRRLSRRRRGRAPLCLPGRRRAASCRTPPPGFSPTTSRARALVVDPARLRVVGRGWSGRPWEEAVIYEAHVGTATPQGTYAGLTTKLAHLADAGVPRSS